MRREFHLSEQHVDALMKILKEHERT